MTYKRIIKTDGTSVPHTSIHGLKLAIKHRQQQDGKYVGIKKNGEHDTWEIVSKPYVLKGRRSAGKTTFGKGINILNPKAQLV